MIGDGAGVDELADLRGEILADARQCRAGPPGVERGDAVGMMRDGLRGVAIRADLEGVLVLDLEQIADLGEHARDGEVVHAGGSGCAQHYRLYNASMSIRDAVRQAGQLAIAGFAGHSIPADLRALAKEFDLGGIILFARNVESPEQVAEIAREAQTLARELPLWVSVDQEGGRVARLRSPFTVWPPMQTLGRSGDETAGGEIRAGRWPPSCARSASRSTSRRCSTSSPIRRIPSIGDRALAEHAGRRRPARDGRSSRPCRRKASPPAASTFPGTATRASTRMTRCRSSSIRPIGWRRSSSCRSGRRLPRASPAS